MAKKNRGGLLDKWVTTAPTSAPVKETETTSTETSTDQTQTGKNDLDPNVAQSMGVTPEMEEQLNELRNSRRTGRPKGTGHKEKNPFETRATFVVDSRQVRKLKFISLKESRLHKDVISEALSRYIDEWESKNGIINL